MTERANLDTGGDDERSFAIASAYLRVAAQADRTQLDPDVGWASWELLSGRPGQDMHEVVVCGLLKSLSSEGGKNPIDRDEQIISLDVPELRPHIQKVAASTLLMMNAYARQVDREMRQDLWDSANAMFMRACEHMHLGYRQAQINNSTYEFVDKLAFAQKSLLTAYTDPAQRLERFKEMSRASPIARSVLEWLLTDESSDLELRSAAEIALDDLAHLQPSLSTLVSAMQRQLERLQRAEELTPETVVLDSPQDEPATGFIAKINSLLADVPAEEREAFARSNGRVISTYLRLLSEAQTPLGVADQVVLEPLCWFILESHRKSWSAARSILRQLGMLWDGHGSNLKRGECFKLGEFLGRHLLDARLSSEVLGASKRLTLGSEQREAFTLGLVCAAPWYSSDETSYLTKVADLGFKYLDGNEALGPITESKLRALGVPDRARKVLRPKLSPGSKPIAVTAALSDFVVLVHLIGAKQSHLAPPDLWTRLVSVRPAYACLPGQDPGFITLLDDWAAPAFRSLTEESASGDNIALLLRPPGRADSIKSGNGHELTHRIRLAIGLPEPLLLDWMRAMAESSECWPSGLPGEPDGDLLWSRVQTLLRDSRQLLEEGTLQKCEALLLTGRQLAIAEAFVDLAKYLDVPHHITEAVQSITDCGLDASQELLEGSIAAYPRSYQVRNRTLFPSIRERIDDSGRPMSPGLWATFIIGAFGPDDLPEDIELEDGDATRRLCRGQEVWNEAITDLRRQETVDYFSAGEVTQILKAVSDLHASVGTSAYDMLAERFIAEVEEDRRLRDKGFGSQRLRIALTLLSNAHEDRSNDRALESLEAAWKSAFPGEDFPRVQEGRGSRPFATSQWQSLLQQIREMINGLEAAAPPDTLENAPEESATDELRKMLNALDQEPRVYTNGEVQAIQRNWAAQIAHELSQKLTNGLTASFDRDLPTLANQLKPDPDRFRALAGPESPGAVRGSARLRDISLEASRLGEALWEMASIGQPAVRYLRTLHALFEATSIGDDKSQTLGELLLTRAHDGTQRAFDALSQIAEEYPDRNLLVEFSRSEHSTLMTRTLACPESTVLWGLKILVRNGFTHATTGDVTIRVRPSRTGRAVELSVIDEGQGLPKVLPRTSQPHRAIPGAKAGIQTTELALAVVGGGLERVRVDSRDFFAIVVPLAP